MTTSDHVSEPTPPTQVWPDQPPIEPPWAGPVGEPVAAPEWLAPQPPLPPFAPQPPFAPGLATPGATRFTWRRPRPWWGCGDIFIGIGLTVVASFVFGIPLLLAGVDESSLAYEAFSAGSVWVGLGGWALFCSWVKGLGRLKLDFGWAFRWFDPFIGIGLAFFTLLIGAGLDVVQTQLGVEAASNTGFLQDAVSTGVNWTYLGFILIVAVGAPVVEELFFRGLTFSALQNRYNGLVAVVGSSVIFGALHYQPGDLVPTVFFLINISIFGLVLGTSRFLFKRTGPGVFAHMAFNLTAAVAILLTATR
jgi:membrane protease YdiL (CAAX protease family)